MEDDALADHDQGRIGDAIQLRQGSYRGPVGLGDVPQRVARLNDQLVTAEHGLGYQRENDRRQQQRAGQGLLHRGEAVHRFLRGLTAPMLGFAQRPFNGRCGAVRGTSVPLREPALASPGTA